MTERKGARENTSKREDENGCKRGPPKRKRRISGNRKGAEESFTPSHQEKKDGTKRRKKTKAEDDPLR